VFKNPAFLHPHQDGFGPVGVFEKFFPVAGTPGNLHGADKLGSPGFEELKNVALVAIHGTSFANNAAGVERFNIAVDGKSIFQFGPGG
jgi:hypothetical protein